MLFFMQSYSRSACYLFPILLTGSVVAYSLIRRSKANKLSWGDLPPELCKEIGIRIDNRLDILNFRSVCKTWRSSVPFPTRFPLQVPLPPNFELNHPLVHKLTFFITEVSIADDGLSYISFEEMDQGGKFNARFLYPSRSKFDLDSLEKHPLSILTFISKAYHLRTAFPLFDSNNRRDGKKWNLLDNPFVTKMVIISSCRDGVNSSYVQTSDLSVVAHLTETMKGRLALLRLGGPSKNWEWDTNFCTQVFEDITTYNGQLCALDASGRVFAMDYNSLQMMEIAPPSSIPREMKNKYLFEAIGYLYLFEADNDDLVLYKLSLQHKKWVKVEDMTKVLLFLTPYHIRTRQPPFYNIYNLY